MEKIKRETVFILTIVLILKSTIFFKDLNLVKLTEEIKYYSEVSPGFVVYTSAPIRISTMLMH